MEALKAALREGRPVAVFYDRGQIRFVVEGQDRQMAEYALPVSAGPLGGRFRSLAREFPSLDWFERELFELGLEPEGHPALRPLRRHDRPYPFDRLEGMHEVPVGPVHAGIIEPGHFRFSVLGERIFHLEIRLAYQHRGLLGLFPGKQVGAGLLLAERVSSEPVAHALAFTRAVEKALGLEAPEEAERLRLALLEMERAFGHLGHLAGLFTDIGYAHAATEVGRVRALLQGEIDRLTGHRYGRGFIRLGGTA
ncbi:NADH-quinone oxidoreductase subunit C, partial [Thermus sp.]|uniref:NADH-quinone oxidoreductase subunit C n=1 Tax=Thermus sp. TaxID=275 RepID=UPI0033228C30